MADIKAKDIMTTDVITVTENMAVKDTAKLFTDKKIGGAPVVDSDNRVIGMVTDGDLIMQDVKIHFPSYLHLLDGFIILGSTKRFEEQLRKAVGAEIGDVMSQDVVVVDEDVSIEEVATLMMEKNVSRIPVVKDDKLIGLITRGDIVKAISKG